MFWSKNKKIGIPLHIPVLLYKWGIRGYSLHGHVFLILYMICCRRSVQAFVLGGNCMPNFKIWGQGFEEDFKNDLPHDSHLGHVTMTFYIKVFPLMESLEICLRLGLWFQRRGSELPQDMGQTILWVSFFHEHRSVLC